MYKYFHYPSTSFVYSVRYPVPLSCFLRAGHNSPLILKINVTVANAAPGAPDPAKRSVLEPVEIRSKAKGFFQRIYNHPTHPTLSIDNALELLKKLQFSPNQKKREIYLCVLRKLFDEFKFFHRYPERELLVTAQLLGGIIERNLLPCQPSLEVAIQFILEALRKPKTNKLHGFGIAALDRFKSQLKDQCKFCRLVKAIPHFGDFPPHLIEYVEYGLQHSEPPFKP